MTGRPNTPEAAAMTGFPPEHCRVVASREQGDHAYVLLDTAPGRPYLYGVTCGRHDGRWRDEWDSNGHGWSHTGPDELGTWTLWDEAPPGADRVRVRFRGEAREEPVENGVYLAVWWRVPFEEGASPTLEAVRVGGEWVAAP